MNNNSYTGLEIAVIGMSGRFPGAGNLDQFWKNLKNGIESISFFSKEELMETGIEPRLLEETNYVKAKGFIESTAYFDAFFFDYSPKEAEIMDPQLRILHECTWHALEDAAYVPGSIEEIIGVYIGGESNLYWIDKLLKENSFETHIQTKFLNNSIYFGTRLSYTLDLQGPAITVQTACSSSLVAIHLACQGLLGGECHIALAGGITVMLPEKNGYLHQEGMIYSPDGHCRSFDAKTRGTVFSDGVGIVVLKPLEEATADGDNIHAVIKGSAVNNDGAGKVGFTAPAIKGQARAIKAALKAAEVEPERIGYIETHGTGTLLGDPIEIEALKRAFNTDKKGFCRIGSIKSNIGHLNSAAGVAGFIKAVLALKHRQIPPSLHFETPNPKIDFQYGPFYVARELSAWENDKYPLTAGVSSFGIGGTNAHVILQEAPKTGNFPPEQSKQLFLLSAKTSTALKRTADHLAAHIKNNPHINLANAAYTLQIGRKTHSHRMMLIGSDRGEIINHWSKTPSEGIQSSIIKTEDPSVIFLFPGQGAQYVNMGLGLYQTRPWFCQEVDRCLEIFKSITGDDIKHILYPGDLVSEESSAGSNRSNESYNSHLSYINQTEIAQPVLFIFEYALAKSLMKWGIEPHAMMGHSIGEYVAACLSGVFSLSDALKLVILRGQLMQKVPPGAMLSVPLPGTEIQSLLGQELSLAAVNGPSHCVVSGPHEAVASFEKQLKEKGYDTRPLHTSHAFHSKMMEPILKEFKAHVRQVQLNKPQLPYISNLTGTWITVEEATNPLYWSNHLRQTVQFYHGLQRLMQEKNSIFVEVGPGNGLSTLVKKQPHPPRTVNLIKHPQQNISDEYCLLKGLGQLWLYGVKINWLAWHSGEKRHRISLPPYPFEGQYYWLQEKIPRSSTDSPSREPALVKQANIANWFYVPSWKRSPLVNHKKTTSKTPYNILLFMDEGDWGTKLVKGLEQEYQDVIIVRAGLEFKQEAPHQYLINPKISNHFDRLIGELRKLEQTPGKMIHLWNLSKETGQYPGIEESEKARDFGFYPLLYMAQAIGKQGISHQVQLFVVTNNMQEVTGGELWAPEKSIVLGPVRTIGQEYANLGCQCIDITFPTPNGEDEEDLLDLLLSEFAGDASDPVTAYRGHHRWVQHFEPFPMEKSQHPPVTLRQQGVYLITGGLGGIGLTIAEYLVKTMKAKLILTGRSYFPAKDDWQKWLENHNHQDKMSGKIKKLQQLETLGGEILIFSADVTNKAQMQEAILQAGQRWGPINGIIHSAGLAGGGVIQQRTRETTDPILAPKVMGTLILDDIFKNKDLDFFILCSSLSSILGPMGQVGYCAANAFLDAFANYRNSISDTFTAAINWDAWQEVGMAVEAVKKLSGNLNSSKAKLIEAEHPLFDRYIKENSNQESYITYFSVNKHWPLKEHRIIGKKASLPGTGCLEMVKAAVEKFTPHETINIKDIYFLEPLMVEDNKQKEVRTTIRREGDRIEFKIISQSDTNGDVWMEHAKGWALCQTEESPVKYDIKQWEERCGDQRIGMTEEEFKSQRLFGPRWNCFRWMKFGKDQGLALLELPEEFQSDLESYRLHPALMDTATGFLRWQVFNEGDYLPFSYKNLIIKGALPKKIYSYIQHLKSNQEENDFIEFEITITDEQGVERVKIENYAFKKVTASKGTTPKTIVQKNHIPPAAEPENFTLNVPTPGLLESISFRAASRQAPGPGELEIEVFTIGLNFKDVLYALGMIPVPPDKGLELGLECAGKVVTIGEGVTGFQTGDEVIVLTKPCFSGFITIPASFVTPKPKHLSFEEAVTIPITFLTAYYALVTLGKLRQDERILIHAAAGGVGLAAVKIARWIGAEIFTTAGNQEKRDFLQSLGIKHTLDSRSGDFAHEVMRRTSGEGVNVVLNSLAGELMTKSLSVLSPYGRFLEIGIRDIANNSQIGLEPFHKGLSYFAILIDTKLSLFKSTWKEIIEHFKNKTFSPLPYRVFPGTMVSHAFQYMAQARHIGKIVVSLKDKSELTLQKTPGNGVKAEMPGTTGTAAISPGTDQHEFLKHGILPPEGIDVFERILQRKPPQVVVCTTDLNQRKSRWKGWDTPHDQDFSLIKREKKVTSSQHLHHRSQLTNTYVAPGSNVEKMLGQIIEEYLGIKKIGIFDNFFELGLNSLDLVQLKTKIEKALNRELSVPTLFRYPMIRALAQHLDQEKPGENSPAAGGNRSKEVDKGRNSRQKRLQIRKQGAGNGNR